MINSRNAIPTSSSEALLTYSLLTEPDPLQVNGAGILTLVVSKSPQSTHETITCTEIKVTLLQGKTAKELTTDASNIGTQVPSNFWGADNDGGVITLTPTGDAGKFGPAGISFVFSAFAVNSEPGATIVKIDETASSASNPSVTRTAQFLVPKLPTQFQLSDLTLIDPATPDVPYDGSATLMWTGAGDQVSYSLKSQPADDGTVLSPPIGSLGPYTAENLTRTGSVTFTLTAKVTVPGLDNPINIPRQLTVTIESLSLKASVLPTTVGPNGLVRLEWDAPNAASCRLDPEGTPLALHGVMWLPVPATRLFTFTAIPAKGRRAQQQLTVTVDPSIQPTEAGFKIIGAAGHTGREGYVSDPGYDSGGTPGFEGEAGGDAIVRGILPPLDVSPRPARVIPITLIGGKGGFGGGGGYNEATSEHYGKNFPGGNGGRGGDAILDVTLDAAAGPAAQYIVVMSAGKGERGGDPGSYPSGDSANFGDKGRDGVVTLTIRENTSDAAGEKKPAPAPEN